MISSRDELSRATVAEHQDKSRKRLGLERRCRYVGDHGLCLEPGLAFDPRSGWRSAEHAGATEQS